MNLAEPSLVPGSYFRAGCRGEAKLVVKLARPYNLLSSCPVLCCLVPGIHAFCRRGPCRLWHVDGRIKSSRDGSGLRACRCSIEFKPAKLSPDSPALSRERRRSL
jgi:hypothetical protein